MIEIQKLKYSIASLMRKEFALRIPADGTLMSVNYWDFEDGALKALATSMKQLRNIYTYPVFGQSEFPYMEVIDGRIGFPQNTQQKEDQLVRLQATVWDMDMDEEQLDWRLETYAQTAKDILSEYEDELRTRNRLIKTTVTDAQFNMMVAGDTGWIRPIHVFIEIKTLEA